MPLESWENHQTPYLQILSLVNVLSPQSGPICELIWASGLTYFAPQTFIFEYVGSSEFLQDVNKVPNRVLCIPYPFIQQRFDVRELMSWTKPFEIFG